MVREAEKFAEQDRMKKEEAETRNTADNLIYTAEKTKKDLGDKLKPDQAKRIDDAIAELRKALGGKDVQSIKSKSEALTTLLQEIGSQVYQQAAPPPPKGEAKEAGESEKPPKEKVVDADYKVVDEEK